MLGTVLKFTHDLLRQTYFKNVSFSILQNFVAVQIYEHIMLYLSKGCPLHAEKLLIYHCMVNNFEIHSLPGSFGIIREISFEKYMQQGKKIRL